MRREAKKSGGKGGKGAEPSPPPPPPSAPAPFLHPLAILQSLSILDSYKRTVGEPLLDSGGGSLSVAEAPAALFHAPFVCVSHGAEKEPVFNYGNAAALSLFGHSWAAFTRLESRLSAAADDAEAQRERKAALSTALNSPAGFVRGYSGVRVTASGRRFTINDATLWTMRTPTGPGRELQGVMQGQAAVFSSVTWLDPPGEGEVGEPGSTWRFTGGPEGGMEPMPAPGSEAPPAEAPPPPPAAIDADALAAMSARVDAQASVVREMKAAGVEKGDPALVAAVELLLRLKREVEEAA